MKIIVTLTDRECTTDNATSYKWYEVAPGITAFHVFTEGGQVTFLEREIIYIDITGQPLMMPHNAFKKAEKHA